MRIIAKILFLTAFVVFAANARAETLTIVKDNGEILRKLNISARCGFAVQYTHSVALTPVTDFFRLHDQAIWLDRTEYQDFGAGLPHFPEGNQKMRQTGGKLIIENYNRKVSPFFIRVGRVANHNLLLLAPDKSGECVIQKKIPLNTFTKAGQPLCLDVAN